MQSEFADEVSPSPHAEQEMLEVGAYGGEIDSPPIEEPRAGVDSRDPWAPIPISELGDGEPIEWVWEGFLAREHITMLSALWKVGKTTFLTWLLKQLDEGGELGGAISPGKVLYVTEESDAIWADRRDELQLEDNVELIVRPLKGTDVNAWADFVQRVAGYTKANGYSLVVFDTLSALTPYSDENDAAKMMMALRPLHAITEQGASLLLVHHLRKGDGGEGQGSRGSGALPGFVDVIIEMRRHEAENHDDRRRAFRCYSRFGETPHEAVVEWDGREYRWVGSKLNATREDRVAVLLTILPSGSQGMTSEDLRSRWPQDADVPKPGSRTLKGDLAFLADNGMACRVGHGVRGDPYRFHLPDSNLARTRSMEPESNPTPSDVAEPLQQAVVESSQTGGHE